MARPSLKEWAMVAYALVVLLVKHVRAEARRKLEGVRERWRRWW